MFDYPIPPLRGSLYDRLRLGPEASSEEINEAKQELAARLRARQKVVQRILEEVYQEIPDLRTTWAELKELERAGADADPQKYRQVQVRLSGLEEAALLIRSDFKAIRDEASDLEHQLHEANLMPIQNAEDRLEHDRSHPPFELIKLANCTTSPLDDTKTMLCMVRKELSEFLEQMGEEVFHPSDLTRTDFFHDFTRDHNLDRSQ